MTDPMQEMQEARDQVADIDDEVSYHVFRALVGWTIRWTIGFGLVWAVTAWTGRFAWLWTAALILAALSLILTLGFRYFLARRTRETRVKLDKLTRLIDAREGRTSSAVPDPLDTPKNPDPETPNGKL